MSLEIVRAVGRDNPTWLPTNLGRTCYAHTVELVARLRAAGHEASLMCKMEAEGGYTPQGFVPRMVEGLDGKQYLCSRVSHDAIYCDGKQYDTLGSANEYDRPIYRRQGDPNWSFDPNDGPQITASPLWNAIPSHYWRPWNPPLRDVVAPGPIPPPPAPPMRFPSYAEMGDDQFFRDAIGKPLFEDEQLVGEGMNDGSSVWFSRGSHRLVESFFKHGNHSGAAEIVKDLRNQWRTILRAAYPAKAHLIPPLMLLFTLFAGPVSAQSDSRWLHAAIGASMVAHGADLSTTSWAIGTNPDRFKEHNPILKPFADDPVKLAVAKMGTAVAINYALLKFHERKPKTVLFVAIAQTIAIGYVAHRNAELVKGVGR